MPVSQHLPGYRGSTFRRDLLAGLTVAALALPAAMAYANVRLHPRAQVTPGVLVYRLFFANASYVKGRVREALHGAPAPVRWFVFDAEASPTSMPPASTPHLTGPVAPGGGITFVFARLKDPTRQTLQEAGVLDSGRQAPDHPTVRAAVAAAAGEEQQ